MKFLKNGLVLLGSLCFILLLLEIVFRFLPVRSVLHTDVLNDAKPIPSYLANERGVWSRDWNFSIVNTLQTNNLGFVNPQDYVKTDNPVVAVIGDSFVEAAMVTGPRGVSRRVNEVSSTVFSRAKLLSPRVVVWRKSSSLKRASS